jgi:hypothetical protein
VAVDVRTAVHDLRRIIRVRVISQKRQVVFIGGSISSVVDGALTSALPKKAHNLSVFSPRQAASCYRAFMITWLARWHKTPSASETSGIERPRFSWVQMRKEQEPVCDTHTFTATREQRVVRVFVSSTFRDMHAERDELIKRTFPQLCRLYRAVSTEPVRSSLWTTKTCSC